jgi:hypothetical protein
VVEDDEVGVDHAQEVAPGAGQGGQFGVVAEAVVGQQVGKGGRVREGNSFVVLERGLEEGRAGAGDGRGQAGEVIEGQEDPVATL